MNRATWLQDRRMVERSVVGWQRRPRLLCDAALMTRLCPRGQSLVASGSVGKGGTRIAPKP